MKKEFMRIIVGSLIVFLSFSCSRDWRNPLGPESNNSIPSNGLVAYYPFNGNANDETGNNNDGKIHGASPANDRFNKNDGALLFDGIDDYVEIPHNNSLNPGEGSISIQVVFKTDINSLVNNSPTGANMLISKCQYDFGNGYSLGFNWIDKTIYFMISDRPKFNYNVSIYFNESESFHHIFFIYDTERNYLKFYFDGKLSAQVLTNCQTVNPTNSLFIGKYHQINIGYLYFKGLIDDIRIYNRVLNDNEIKALYHEGGWGQ